MNNISRVRLSLDVSSDLNQLLENMAQRSRSSISDVLRKSIVLMEVALAEKEKGNHLSVVSKDKEIVKDIVGL